MYCSDDLKITPLKNGADRYTKISYPLRYGKYSEIETKEFILQFNLNGEITFAKGKNGYWLDPQEWLKRSVGNDWVYYSTGGYTGVFEAIGEFYLPNLQYPTNSLIGGKPFANSEVSDLLSSWYQKIHEISSRAVKAPDEVKDLLSKIRKNSPGLLKEKAKKLFDLCGGRVTVLPPDSRHVDYDVLPVSVSTGCLYKCRFCKVKSTRPFAEKSLNELDSQIQGIKSFYCDNLVNYNSVFLGEHDALAVSADKLVSQVEVVYESLDLASSFMKGANFFLFGSVDSLLGKDEGFFEQLRKLPINFYINIGFESADQQTLEQLGKPVNIKKIKDGFAKMQKINDGYLNIEVTGNFLMDESLPAGHYPAFLKLVRDSFTRKKPKGSIYLSPLKFGEPSRELVMDFNKLKLASRLPTFLYIIQRL